MKKPGADARAHEDVSLATRWKVDDPAGATEELAESLQTWQLAMSKPEVVAGLAADGMTPGVMKLVSHSLTRNLEDMTRGKAEANAILAHVDRFALRTYP
jgi:hypothetical protein